MGVRPVYADRDEVPDNFNHPSRKIYSLVHPDQADEMNPDLVDVLQTWQVEHIHAEEGIPFRRFIQINQND